MKQGKVQIEGKKNREKKGTSRGKDKSRYTRKIKKSIETEETGRKRERKVVVFAV